MNIPDSSSVCSLSWHDLGEEQEGGKGLVSGRGGDILIDRQMGEDRHDLRRVASRT